MTLRRTRDREQDRGHPVLPGEALSPGLESAASQAPLYGSGSLPGPLADWGAAEQVKDRSGTARTALALRYAVRSEVPHGSRTGIQ